LHDELQFAGGELPNQVLHSDAANSQSQPQLQSSPYSQCDAKHSVPDGLYLDPAGVPGRMRAELPLSLKKPAIRAPLWHGLLGKRELRFAIQFPGNDGLPYYRNCGLVGKGKGDNESYKRGNNSGALVACCRLAAQEDEP